MFFKTIIPEDNELLYVKLMITTLLEKYQLLNFITVSVNLMMRLFSLIEN